MMFHCCKHQCDQYTGKHSSLNASFVTNQENGNYPPASEASRGGIIFTEEKKNTPTRIWCQNFVTLSIFTLKKPFMDLISQKYIYPDSHHSQGGMKFATQISPLLNLK